MQVFLVIEKTEAEDNKFYVYNSLSSATNNCIERIDEFYKKNNIEELPQ